MQIDIENAYEALGILEDSNSCTFWACPGPDHVHLQMPTRAVGTTARDQLDKVVEYFTDDNPLVDVWKRVPDVDDGDDDEACDTMAAAFTAFCAEYGLNARTTRAEGFGIAFTDYHCWTSVQISPTEQVQVDWTARQFHNLDYPTNPAHADIACPLVWTGDAHPILGPAASMESPSAGHA